MNCYGRERGLTLIELMITLLVAAVLMAIAVPNLTSMLSNNRAQAQAGLLFRAFNYARGEAIRRSHEVRISSLSGTTDWAQGWRVWVDNGNDIYDVGEEIQHQDPLTGAPTLTGTGSTVKILSSGYLNDGGVTFATEYYFPYSLGTGNSYCTKVAHAGRVSFEKKATCP